MNGKKEPTYGSYFHYRWRSRSHVLQHNKTQRHKVLLEHCPIPSRTSVLHPELSWTDQEKCQSCQTAELRVCQTAGGLGLKQD